MMIACNLFHFPYFLSEAALNRCSKLQISCFITDMAGKAMPVKLRLVNSLDMMNTLSSRQHVRTEKSSSTKLVSVNIDTD